MKSEWMARSVLAGLALTAAAQTPAGGVSQMFGVRVDLEKPINSRNAHAGMSIEARPETRLHLADGVELEQSSRLMGSVVSVQPSVDGSAASLSVLFDKVRLKGGRELPVKVTVLWVGQAIDLLHPSVTSAPADRTTPGVGVEAGSSATPPLQGFAGSEIAGGPLRPHERPLTAQAELPPGISVQRGGVPGVNLFSDMRRPESAFFRAPKGNVALPGGTVMALVMLMQPESSRRSVP